MHITKNVTLYHKIRTFIIKFYTLIISDPDEDNKSHIIEMSINKKKEEK